MFNYNKRNVIIISFILAIIVYILIHIIFNSFKINQKKEVDSTLILKTSNINPITIEGNTNEEKVSALEEITLNQYKQYDWRIIISKIKLDAPILEGTSKEVLRRGVGHFDTTSKLNGNVCLAAHNRGYKYNYFEELKNLEIGDVIFYQKGKEKRKYGVIIKEKIKETDWSYLKETKDNYLTLITCVENMPEYRLCIQAKEIKQKEG